jgi:hypothetical protein
MIDSIVMWIICLCISITIEIKVDKEEMDATKGQGLSCTRWKVVLFFIYSISVAYRVIRVVIT